MSTSTRSKVSKVGLRLISLALALLLEFYFYSQDNSVTELVSAVLEIENIPSDRIIIEPSHAEEGIPAHFELRGPRSVVHQIGRRIHVVKIPFPEGQPFNASIDVKYESLGFPPSVRIESVRPARISLKTVEVVRKEVPVEVSIEGAPAKGFVFSGTTIFPKTVIIRGPIHEVAAVKSIKVKPLNIDGFSESQKLEVRLTSPDEFTSLNVSLVSVDIQIHEVRSELQLKEVVVMKKTGFLEGKDASTFSPSKVTLFLEGAVSLLNSVRPEDIKVVISPENHQISEVKTGKNANDLTSKVEIVLSQKDVVGLPENVLVKKIVPSKVKLRKDR